MNCEHRLTPDPRSGIRFCAKCGIDEAKVRREQKPSETAELRRIINGFLEWHEGNPCPDGLMERARAALAGKPHPSQQARMLTEKELEACFSVSASNWDAAWSSIETFCEVNGIQTYYPEAPRTSQYAAAASIK